VTVDGDAVNIMPWLLYSRKEPWYPLNRRQTEPHSHSGDFWRREKSFVPRKKKYFISLREQTLQQAVGPCAAKKKCWQQEVLLPSC